MASEHGKAAIRKAMSNFGGARKVDIPEGATSRPRTHHQIINHVIDVHGDTATTIAYWFAMTNNTPQRDVQLLYFGHYEDELVRVNGKWLFKRRNVYNESKPNRALFYPGLGEKDPRARRPPASRDRPPLLRARRRLFRLQRSACARSGTCRPRSGRCASRACPSCCRRTGRRR